MDDEDFDFDDDDDELLSQIDVDDDQSLPQRKRPSTEPVTHDSKLIVLDKSSSFTKTPKKLTKRRFPGPAGLLPNLKSSEFKLLDKSRSILSPAPSRASNSTLLKSPSPQVSSQEDCVSNGIQTLLEKQTRSELTDHLELKSNNNNNLMLSTLNILWIRKNISWLPTSAKIPFLLMTLQDAPELNRGIRQFKTPCVRCLDETGSIEAAIDYNFAMKYLSDLTPGTCLAVQNVSLLRLRKAEVMLTITTRNLICMASFVNEEEREEETSQKSTDKDKIRLTKFCEFIPEQILNNLEELLKLKTQIQAVEIKSSVNVTDKNRKTSEYFLTDQNRNFAEQTSVQVEQSVNMNFDDIDDQFFAELDMELLEEGYGPNTL